jgi:hypothetical protein
MMKTGQVTGAQKRKERVYNFPCDCDETRRLLEARIKEHKYNLTPGLLEKSKLVQHAYEEGHKIRWK